MNDKILLAQNLKTDGRVSFEGLYDIDDNPVTVVIDRNGNSVFMVIFKDDEEDEYEDDEDEDFDDDDFDEIDPCSICEDCLREECSQHDDCSDCPIRHCCERIFPDDEGGDNIVLNKR